MASEKWALNSNFNLFWIHHFVRIEDLEFAQTSVSKLFTLSSLHSEYATMYSEFDRSYHGDTPVIGLARVNQFTYRYWLGLHVSFVNVYEGCAQRPCNRTSIFNSPSLWKQLSWQNLRLRLVGVAHRDNLALVRWRADCKAVNIWHGLVDWISLVLKIWLLL